MRILTSNEIRRVEEVENATATPFIRLMENAGSACTISVLKEMKARGFSKSSSVCIVCGKGKNAGDGFVIARKLKNVDIKVVVVLAFGDPQAPDAVEMYEKAIACGVEMIHLQWNNDDAVAAINSAAVLVDCMFGIGFHGEPSDDVARAMRLVNDAPGRVITVDVPSGVDTDTGAVCEDCVRADVTLAITTAKPAHVFFPAREYCGTTKYLDIGILEDSFLCVDPPLFTYSQKDYENGIPKRDKQSHKNDFGHVLIIAGSYRMPGAASLCANAALRAGSGLVTAAFPESAYASLASHTCEAMLLPLPQTKTGTISTAAIPEIKKAMEKASAIVIGPGLSQNEDIKTIVEQVIRTATCPIVLDADGLNVISENVDVLLEKNNEIIITPHPGEMSRLCKKSVADIEKDRINTAKDFANKYKITVLLKGAATIVATYNNKKIYVNSTGNPGLSKGGSGDTLSGIIAGLLGQKLKPFDAASFGAALHGRAADIALETMNERAILASDIIKNLI